MHLYRTKTDVVKNDCGLLQGYMKGFTLEEVRKIMKQILSNISGEKMQVALLLNNHNIIFVSLLLQAYNISMIPLKETVKFKPTRIQNSWR